MQRIKTPAVIYKLSRYSDNSAIATAYTLSHGKIKLFISKAYTKKGGISKILPGDLDFLKKSNSDLNKFYAFYQNIGMWHFLDSPDVYLRMNLVFEIFDALYTLDMPDERLWRLIANVTPENILKSSIYIGDYMLSESGFKDELTVCSDCGKSELNEAYMLDNKITCLRCSTIRKFYMTPDLMNLFSALNDKKIYKTFYVNKDLEKLYWTFFNKYFSTITGKGIKTLDTMKQLE